LFLLNRKEYKLKNQTTFLEDDAFYNGCKKVYYLLIFLLTHSQKRIKGNIIENGKVVLTRY